MHYHTSVHLCTLYYTYGCIRVLERGAVGEEARLGYLLKALRGLCLTGKELPNDSVALLRFRREAMTTTLHFVQRVMEQVAYKFVDANTFPLG